MPTANNRNACNKWKWAIPRNDKTIDAKPQSMAMQISSTKRMMFRHYMVVRRLGFFSFCLPASIYRTQPYITIAFTKFDHIILTIRSIGTNVCKSDCAKTNENDFQLWIEWNSKVAPVFFWFLVLFWHIFLLSFSVYFPLRFLYLCQQVLSQCFEQVATASIWLHLQHNFIASSTETSSSVTFSNKCIFLYLQCC